MIELEEEFEYAKKDLSLGFLRFTLRWMNPSNSSRHPSRFSRFSRFNMVIDLGLGEWKSGV